jgi:dephospho-CoA kinase
MLLAGLTGGIASGKTVVAREFSRLGAYVIDADELARQVTQPGEPAWRRLVACFGNQILKSDQHINRMRLGELVFADKSLLAKLNEIVHPPVIQEEKRRIARIAERDHEAIIVADVPLLIETGHHRQMDRVVVVTADRERQIQRLLARGLSKAQAEARIAAQLPLAEKLKYADFVIDNNGSLEQTYQQVRDVFAELKRLNQNL